MHKQMEGKTNQEILDFLSKRFDLTEFERSGRLKRLPKEGTTLNDYKFNQKYAGTYVDENKTDKDGYVLTSIDRVKFKVSHIVYFLKARELWPEDHEIDHINLVRNDNRPENLRAVTKSENCRNRQNSVTIFKHFQRKKEVKEWLTIQNNVETVLLSDIVTENKTFKPLKLRKLDPAQAQEVRESITSDTNGSLVTPLRGVRLRGETTVYLAKGRHRLAAVTRLGHAAVPMQVFEVDNLDEVTPAANEINAILSRLPSTLVTSKQCREALYIEMFHNKLFRENSNAELHRQSGVDVKTIAKMRLVIHYLETEKQEPQGWIADSLMAIGKSVEKLSDQELSDRMADRYARELLKDEHFKKCVNNQRSLGIILHKAGVEPNLEKAEATIQALKDGSFKTCQDRFDRDEVIEQHVRDQIRNLRNKNTILDHFEPENVDDFDPIRPNKRSNLMG